MRGKQIEMHHIREVLRLKAAGASNRMISGSLGIARSTVADIVARASTAGMTWPEAGALADAALAAAIFKRTAQSPHLGVRRHAEPDWAAIHLELKRPHVTLMLLWEEYRAQHADGYGYSRFCELYRGFEDKLSPTMRQTHVAGEKLFVDFAGATVPVLVDQRSGKIRQAQIFVATLGASSYTYVEATWTQTTGRLGWRANQRAHLLWRRAERDCAGQSEGGDRQGVLLRAGRAADLRRLCRAL